MTKKSDKSFRELEQDLSKVMQRIEEAEYDELDELLADYETGQRLITELEKKLTEAKNSITKVNKGKE